MRMRKKGETVNGAILWLCTQCHQWLPGDKFFGDKKASNGLTSACRMCVTKTSLRTRNRENANRINREYARRRRLKYPEQVRAYERESSKRYRRKLDYRFDSRQMLRYAVKLGIVIKPKRCERCGEIKKLTGHHEDYYKPLEVEWLCYECHGNKTAHLGIPV